LYQYKIWPICIAFKQISTQKDNVNYTWK
jgi:hypothetical protein